MPSRDEREALKQTCATTRGGGIFDLIRTDKMQKLIWILITAGFLLWLLLVDRNINAAKAFVSGITGGVLIASTVLYFAPGSDNDVGE